MIEFFTCCIQQKDTILKWKLNAHNDHHELPQLIYFFYHCSVIWMPTQVAVQIEKFRLNLDGFFWNMCYFSLANIKKNKKHAHLATFCSIWFPILTLTLIKREAFSSNFAEDSRTLNTAAYKTYNILKINLYMSC